MISESVFRATDRIICENMIAHKKMERDKSNDKTISEIMDPANISIVICDYLNEYGDIEAMCNIVMLKYNGQKRLVIKKHIQRINSEVSLEDLIKDVSNAINNQGNSFDLIELLNQLEISLSLLVLNDIYSSLNDYCNYCTSGNYSEAYASLVALASRLNYEKNEQAVLGANIAMSRLKRK